ncbi:hypothetical protein, partial [Pseudomonas aeruginosa]|uniref:hypothetical protein n=1 Tax=Pseudomonas aeruginosa TaxID=287 RepID=UPI001C1218C2
HLKPKLMPICFKAALCLQQHVKPITRKKGGFHRPFSCPSIRYLRDALPEHQVNSPAIFRRIAALALFECVEP